MAESRTKNSFRNILWGFLNKAMSILLPFGTKTAIIYVLGVEYIGLDSLFTSILNVLNLAELGFDSAIVFSMYRPIATGDKIKINALLALYKKCYRIVGTFILLVGLVLVPFLRNFIHGDIPEGVSLEGLYLIYLANTVLTYYLFAYKRSLFIGVQRSDYVSNIESVVSIFKAVLQIVLLIVFRSYLFYALVLPLGTVINNLLIALFFKMKFPDYDCKGKLAKKERKTIFANVGALFLQKIGNIALFSASSIIVSAFLGLAVLGVYSNYAYVVSAVMALMNVVINSITPSVGNSLILLDIDANYKNFKKFNFLYVWIAAWFASCLFVLIGPFINVWIGEANLLPIEYSALFAILFFMHKLNDMTYIYRQAAGIWIKGMLVPLISAFLNISLGIILVNFIGLPGVLIASIIALLAIYTPFYTRVLFKEYFHDNKKWIEYLKGQFLWIIKALLVAMVSFYVASLVPNGDAFSFLFKVVLMLFVPNICLLILNFRNSNFKFAKQFVTSATKRIFYEKFNKKND